MQKRSKGKKADQPDIFYNIAKIGETLDRTTDEVYDIRIQIYDSYFKSIINFILAAGIGLFLILIFAAIISFSTYYWETWSFFLIYLSFIEIMLLYSIIRFQYKRYIRRIDRLLKEKYSSKGKKID